MSMKVNRIYMINLFRESQDGKTLYSTTLIHFLWCMPLIKLCQMSGLLHVSVQLNKAPSLCIVI